jgi:hypothetical protein
LESEVWDGWGVPAKALPRQFALVVRAAGGFRTLRLWRLGVGDGFATDFLGARLFFEQMLIFAAMMAARSGRLRLASSEGLAIRWTDMI